MRQRRACVIDDLHRHIGCNVSHGAGNTGQRMGRRRRDRRCLGRPVIENEVRAHARPHPFRQGIRQRASRRDDDFETAAKVAVGIIEVQEAAEAAGRCDQPLHLVKLERLQGFHRRRAGEEHRATARQHVEDVPEPAARAHAVVAEKPRAIRKFFPVHVIVAREPRQLVVVREPDGFCFARGA